MGLNIILNLNYWNISSSVYRKRNSKTYAAIWYMRYELLIGSETQLVISKGLKYVDKEGIEKIDEKLDRLPKMMAVLVGKLK